MASLVANLVWNCSTCGWDLDGVPIHEALLVAIVPLFVAPVGALILGTRALVLRTSDALLDLLGAVAGLALPWLYWLLSAP